MNSLSNGLRVGLAYISEYTNRCQPINRFPPEVLSMVFLELKVHYTYCDIPPGPAQHYQCLQTFSVCRYWRTIALGCSELWTCVYLSPKTIDIAELFCSRSAERGISLVVRDFDESKCPIRMWDLIKSCSGRIKKLAAVDCRIPNLPEVKAFPVMTALINRGSEIGPQKGPQAQQILYQNGLKHACLRLGPTLLGGLRVLPKLISLRLDLSPLKSRDQSIVLRTEAIINLLDTQPLLQELIFERVPSLSRVSPEMIYPRLLGNLRRLAFYGSHTYSVYTILSLIQHLPATSISIDVMRQWQFGVEQTAVSEFLARTIPNADPGYTCLHLYVTPTRRRIDFPGQSIVTYGLFYAIDFVLTGTGATYKYSAILTAETKDYFLACIAESGRFDALKTIWTPSSADVLVPQIYSWLPSVSQLATLTLSWSSALWAQPSSMGDLFSALPPNLATLILQLEPFVDDDIASSNFDNLVTLNKRRGRPVKIRLCFRVNATRRVEILAKYPGLTLANHIETMLSSDRGSRAGAFCEVPRGADIDVTRHDYWPSWLNPQEAEQSRLAREALIKK